MYRELWVVYRTGTGIESKTFAQTLMGEVQMVDLDIPRIYV